MPTLSVQELSRILSQPGYAISDGSSLPATLQKSGVDGATADAVSNHAKTSEKRRSAVLWASERDFARAVAAERDIRATLQPEYRLLHHVSNENSHREPGVLAGVPDWDWPIARSGYHGFRLEIKVGKNQPSPMQVAVMNLLRAEGQFCAVIWDSLEQVFDLCDAYLRGEL